MKILALDLGTKTGWAHSDGPSGVWDLRIKRDESGGMRLIRLGAKLREIRDGVGVELVVFEAARYAAPGMQGALVVLAEMQGQVKAWVEASEGIECRGYSSKEIKVRATGKGNANKEAMLVAAKRRWPDVKVLDHNHADALWLLDLAMDEFGE